MILSRDYPRLSLDAPEAVLRPRTINELVKIISQKKYSHIVSAGTRKSHGGHLHYQKPHAVLDMTSLSRIYSLKDNILIVDAGTTWQAIQNYLQPHGLSPLCQQSSYDFTVGGSIAGNIHGRDIRASSIEHSIEWIELAQADGSLTMTSRTEQKKLFWNLFASQGALGVIARVGLRVVANSPMRQRSLILPANQLTEWFEKNRSDITFFIARPKITSNFDEVLITTWHAQDGISDDPLGDEKNWQRDKFVFWASTKHRTYMRIRWQLENMVAQKDVVISRSNAMRPPATALKMFGTSSKYYSYAVQEIFVPKDQLEKTLGYLANLNNNQPDIQLAGVTIRHISKQTAPLGYAADGEKWAIMQYWKIPRNQIGLARYAWLQRELAQLCSQTSGRAYLSYTSLLPPKTLLVMYPALAITLKLKKTLDPSNVFMSEFIERLLAIETNE